MVNRGSNSTKLNMICHLSFLDKGRGVIVHKPLEIGDTEIPTADPIILATETTGG